MRFVRQPNATKLSLSYCVPVWYCCRIFESSYVKPRCWRWAIRIQREEANRRKYLSACLYHTVRCPLSAISESDDVHSVYSACNSRRAAQIPEFAEFMTHLVYQSRKRHLQFFKVVLEIQRRKCKSFLQWINTLLSSDSMAFSSKLHMLWSQLLFFSYANYDTCSGTRPYVIFALRGKPDLLARYLSYGGMIQSET
jgi:hypothetical protein